MYTNRILIKSDREYLREVFARIEKGKYAVPSFQRDFVWKDKQVLELFDSIIKGYPIGAITLWHSEDLYRRKDILTDKEYEDKQFDYYILDGRQRLTALYGCCNGINENNDKRFLLSYNLIEDTLVFAKSGDETWIVPISEIYDTFKMLRRLRLLEDSGLDEIKIRACNERLMQINTILQEYVISEILIEKCSLQEAAEVFARINSKGTEINQMEMLQAVAFGNPSGLLMRKEIKKIKRKLEPYGFDALDDMTIMNCFYKYADLNFYESKAIDLAKYNFEEHLNEITSSVCRTAAFLHNDCYVLSSALLPYSRQFIALASFFKEVPTPTEEQKQELRRWFFYTTVCQSFMNGSLSNVRSIFNAFDNYVKGDRDSASDYEVVKLPAVFKFKVSFNSALSNFMMITQIRKRLISSPKLISSTHISYYRLFSCPSAYFPVLDKSEKAFFNGLATRNNSLFLSDNDLNVFFLTEALLSMYYKGDVEGFDNKRTALLLGGEKELLEDCGLKVEDNRPT